MIPSLLTVLTRAISVGFVGAPTTTWAFVHRSPPALWDNYTMCVCLIENLPVLDGTLFLFLNNVGYYKYRDPNYGVHSYPD